MIATPEIRLFTQTANPFAEKVAAALALKSLPFVRVLSTGPEDIARWSPELRTLPVLEIDGERRAESNEIVDWIHSLYPEPRFLSSDPRTAEAQQQLADWSNNSFGWYWERWNAAHALHEADTQHDEVEAPLGLAGRIAQKVVRAIGGAPRDVGAEREQEIVRELEDRLDDLVSFLGDRRYFHASEPSIADVSIYGILSAFGDGVIPQVAETLEKRPTLVAYCQRFKDIIKAVERSPGTD